MSELYGTINISDLYSAINSIIPDGEELVKLCPKSAADIKSALNKIFKDTECTAVYITQNTDKMMFGVKVMPDIDSDKVYEYLMGNENVRIKKYSVEIDSKFIDLIHLAKSNDSETCCKDVSAVLLYEIDRVIGSPTPMDNARNFLNSYLADNKESLSISNSIHYKEILTYGLKDFISKNNSFFYTKSSSEILANEFITACGLCDNIEEAQQILLDSNAKFYEDSEIAQITVFAWTLRLYKALRFRRVGALKMLSKAKLLTPSRIERAELENVYRRITRIDDEALLESVASAVKNKLNRLKAKEIRSIADEYYELNMRSRNVEDEADALYLMRQINNKISILSEYLNSEGLSERDKNTTFESLRRFQDLRDNLSKKTVYRSKAFGIYIDYPEL